MKKILFIGGLFFFFSFQTMGGTLILSPKDVSLYQEILNLQKKGKIKEAQSKEKNIKNPLLKGYILYSRYFSPTYKTSKSEISQWMEKYSDYPVASEIYALGLQKKIKKLHRPKGLFGGNTKACDSTARIEPLDLVRSISFSYSDKKKRISAQKKKNQFIKYLVQGKTLNAKKY